MSNVLPEKAKNAIWGMYRSRFLIAGSLVAISVAALSALALSPSYVVLSVESGGITQQASTDAATAQQDRTDIIHTQGLLSILSPLLSTTTPTTAIAHVIAARPAGVTIYHITLTTGKPGSIVVSGMADTIEAISHYQNTLRADTLFSGVSVPVGDLAGTADGQFSVTLSGNF